VKDFSRRLLDWYHHYKRELPWRGEINPYKIWISEIILQQTRIAQGWDYYLRFIDRFPTVIDLADATEDEVLKYWQGLGYYSRARNLHAGAQYIMKEFKGTFPQTYKDILKIK
jgi:A/G-specific adenine glycosylase